MRPLFLSALESVDSDVDLGDADQRRELRRRHGAVLAVIAAGGIIGSLIRYQLGRWWPAPPRAFPWATLAINVNGSLLIGALMVVLCRRWQAHPLARPFLGAGVLGGYTTFSTFTVDILMLVRANRPILAAGYLIATLIGALLATTVGMSLTRRALHQGAGPSEPSRPGHVNSDRADVIGSATRADRE